MKQGDFEDFISRSSWRFAKTMPRVPHWYTLKDDSDSREFEQSVDYLRKNGYDDWYKKRKYRAINLGGYKYWTMGAPVEQTTLINRKQITQLGYDEISKTYDKMFSLEKFITENQEVIERIAYEGGSVLDIGCGTGLLLEYIDVKDYTGVDPSLGMLSKFKKKHRGKEYKLINQRYEDWQSNKKFDYIISMFGSPSYIPYEDLKKIKQRLNKGGKMFLMLFKPKYVPYAYTKTSIFIPHFEYKKIPGCLEFHFNEYIINYFENI